MKHILTAVWVIMIDQITKQQAEESMKEDETVDIIPGKLRFANVRNRGGAMGLFSENPRLLAALTAFAGFSVLRQFFRLEKEDAMDSDYKLAMACIVGGAAGNLLDRIRKGYVTDMLQIGRGPVFNIADVYILFGVAGFVLKSVFGKGKGCERL